MVIPFMWFSPMRTAAKLQAATMVRCKMTVPDDRRRLPNWLLAASRQHSRKACVNAVPMREFIQPLLLCVFLTVVSIAAPASALELSKQHDLDGMQFKGFTGGQGKGQDHEDTISFNDGVFRSLDCEGWGFGSALYRVEKVDDSYHFSATLLSPKRGRLEWRGTITGDTAEATFRWRHERWYSDIDRQYWFKGTRVTSQ